MPGTLYVVATPIGNLDDMTYRAVKVLGAVAAVACEDTRVSAKLMQHFALSAPLVSLHEHNEAARVMELLERLERGDDIALISDAGTPLVSDPGFRLVREAAAKGIPVVPLPGASAPIAALSASGLPTDRFTFFGFLPAKTTARRAFLESLGGGEETAIFFEAPHRVLDSLDDMAELLPARPVVLAREVTKLHEEFLRGTAEEVKRALAGRPGGVKGEITLLLGKAPEGAMKVPGPAGLREEIEALERAGVARNEAIKQVARRHGLGKRHVYDAAHGLRSEKDGHQSPTSARSSHRV